MMRWRIRVITGRVMRTALPSNRDGQLLRLPNKRLEMRKNCVVPATPHLFVRLRGNFRFGSEFALSV
ncbi:MAG: hypothetical protein ABW182_05005, partial [Sphingomonas sp.]